MSGAAQPITPSAGLSLLSRSIVAFRTQIDVRGEPASREALFCFETCDRIARFAQGMRLLLDGGNLIAATALYRALIQDCYLVLQFGDASEEQRTGLALNHELEGIVRAMGFFRGCIEAKLEGDFDSALRKAGEKKLELERDRAKLAKGAQIKFREGKDAMTAPDYVDLLMAHEVLHGSSNGRMLFRQHEAGVIVPGDRRDDTLLGATAAGAAEYVARAGRAFSRATGRAFNSDLQGVLDDVAALE